MLFPLLALMSGNAHAQSWSLEASGVLLPEVGTLTEGGVGSPTVVWDTTIDRYVMFFESQTGPITADCPVGEWSIGVAASDDGLNWDVWPTPVVSPTPDTPYRCVAAHPSAMLDGTTMRLFFKAEQGRNACATGGKAWGCKNFAGVVSATVDLSLDDKTPDIAAVQAQIDAIEADRDLAMDTFAIDLQDYRDYLELNEAEFACTGDASPVCTPCASVSFTATRNNPDTQTFCQDFVFTIPSSVSVTSGGNGNHVFALQITPTTGSQFTCFYRRQGGGQYVLDLTPQQGGNNSVDPHCTNNATSGDSVTVGTVSLAVTSSNSGNNPNVTTTLDATNLLDQTYTGGVFDSIDTLLPLLGAYDYDGTIANLPQLFNDLTELGIWLSGFPTDPEKQAMLTETITIGGSAFDLYSNLLAWADELALLDLELQDLLAYVQHVTPSVPTNGVALSIKRSFGFPSAMKSGSSWVMMVQDGAEIKRATATDAAGPFTLDASAVVSPTNTVAWAQTEVFEPNLVCEGGLFPFQMFFGGRTVSGGLLVDGGISDAVSQNTTSWLVNIATQLVGWTDPNEYRHFDVIRSSDGEYRMWTSDNVGGLNQISVYSTTPSFVDSLSQQRTCP
ncbi:MAG: hypothetical protein KC621_16960 [Myxococcales bacterium]|nr:hypothetical protein [Myxococcales bacterium]